MASETHENLEKIIEESRKTAQEHEWKGTCLDYLKKKDANDGKMVVKYFIMRLTDKKSSNAIINRAAVALGNLGGSEALPALEAAREEDEPLVQRHAAWAIEQIKGRHPVDG